MSKFASRLLPQANSLQKIYLTVTTVASGRNSYQEIAAALDADQRQGRYYRLAAETMGLLTNVDNHAELTLSGQELANSSTTSHQELLRAAVLRNPVIDRFVPVLMAYPNGMNRDEIRGWVSQNIEGATGTTLPRRESTIRTWLAETELTTWESGLLRPNQALVDIFRSVETRPELDELPSQQNERAQEFRKRIPVDNFDPDNLNDGRRRGYQSIWQRQGQGAFRRAIVAAYGGRCAITGADVLNAVDAAHIMPYLGTETNHPQNGLLLRADIHNLFDLGLITVDPDSMTVVIAPQLEGTVYEELHGRRLNLPMESELQPSVEALRIHKTAAGM